jgi:hypothetical protein
MDNQLIRNFFLQPTQILQRRYEILRGYFVDERSLADLARTDDLNYYTVRDVVRQFRQQFQQQQIPPFLLSLQSDDLPNSPESLPNRTCHRSPMSDSCS